MSFNCLKNVLLVLHTLGCVRFAVSSLRVVTYNTGMTPRVEEYATRKLEIGPALENLHADVICLQEVWFSQDMSRVLETVGRDMPHSYSALHDHGGEMMRVSSFEAPCISTTFITSFLPCIAWYCMGISSELEYMSCAKQKCGMLEQLDQGCITCLALSGSSKWVTSCLYNPGNRFNVYGLLLLSNRPMRNARVAGYNPDRPLLLPRAYVAAEIEGLGTVVCTHTTADLGPHYYEDLHYGSWGAQNLAEARHLVTSLIHVQTSVVMGDINSSPEVSSRRVEADLEDAYEHFRSHGYSTPYVDRVGICTWCLYNPLSKAKHTLILDHIFVKNLTVTGARRILDDNLDGRIFPLSDHFGLEVTVNTRD